MEEPTGRVYFAALTMKFTREVLQQIRDRIDMVEFVNGYTTLKQKGNRWWGLSPFKPEKTPSFSVKPEDGFYYCFATNQGGDLFRFVSEMEGLSFPEAVEFLAERAGVALEPGTGPTQEDRDKAALYELYDRVSNSFHYLLTQDRRGGEALEYARSRGLSDEVIETFRLGYAPGDPRWLYQFLQRKAYSRGFLDRSGLFSQRGQGYALFRNRLMFPIADERGRTVAFGGRALSPEDRAKYINSPETPIYIKKRTLFGIDQAITGLRSKRTAYIAEGYLDVLAFAQAGVSNAVAPLGTAFTEEQARLLKRWVDEVILVFDADNAGVNATFKAAIVAETAGVGCRAVAVPSGKDPADLYAEQGAEAVVELVSNTTPVFDFLLEQLARERAEAPDTRDELLLQRIFPYISIINSEVRREGAIDALADLLHVSPAAVRSDFESWRRGEQPRRFEKKSTDQSTHALGRDVALVLATAQDGGLFAYLRSLVQPEDLRDRTARQLFLLMEDAYRHDEPLPRGLIDRISEESMRNEVLGRLTSGEFRGWNRDDVDRAVRFMRIRGLEEQARQVEGELRRVTGDDPAALRRLLERKMAIDQELGDLKVRADD